MYYLLDRFGAKYPCRWIGDEPFVKGMNFRKGKKISVPVPDPLEYTLKSLNPDSDDHGPEMPEYFKGRMPLFRNDFIDAMKKRGVDNIDLYNVVIIDPDDGSRHTNYKAVNIIGELPRDVLKRSKESDSLDGLLLPVNETDLQSIDKNNVKRLLIFRIEDAIGIFVHEKLKNHLLAAGFNKLEFLELKDSAI